MTSFKIDHSAGLVMDVSIGAKIWCEMLVRPEDMVMRAAMAAFQIASIAIEREAEVSVRLSTDEIHYTFGARPPTAPITV